MPFIDQDVEIHPKGLIYLPHERLRNRLNDAFGAGWYRFIPVGDPVVGSLEVLWRYRLEFRDGTWSEAPGHAKYIKNNPDYSYGDALETAKSDAFARCCKDVGIGLQCWNRDYQIEYMQRYAVRVQSTKDNKWYWRRKDRPPIPYEKVNDRQPGPDYERKRDYSDDAKDHMLSMRPKRGSAWDDSSMDSLTKDEHFAPESDPDDARRLHEMEEAVFASDGRED